MVEEEAGDGERIRREGSEVVGEKEKFPDKKPSTN